MIRYGIYFMQFGVHSVAVNVYKSKKETAVYKRRNSTQNNTKAKNTYNRKQIYETSKQT
jgi:hypothetical protein